MKAVGIVSTSEIVKGIVVLAEGVEIPADVPLLDSHRAENGVLGHLNTAWVADGALLAEITFTGAVGRRAFGLVERGSMNGISGRFDFRTVAIVDINGREIDADEAIERGADDPALIVLVKQSVLREVSLTSMPADPACVVRACTADAVAWDLIRDGEAALQHILSEYRGGDDNDRGARVLFYGDGWRQVELPPEIVFTDPPGGR